MELIEVVEVMEVVEVEVRRSSGLSSMHKVARASGNG